MAALPLSPLLVTRTMTVSALSPVSSRGGLKHVSSWALTSVAGTSAWSPKRHFRPLP